MLCVRYVALRSGSVSYTAMLLRLSRPYSYDPRPISKKAKKTVILIRRHAYLKDKINKKADTNLIHCQIEKCYDMLTLKCF